MVAVKGTGMYVYSRLTKYMCSDKKEADPGRLRKVSKEEFS